MRPSGKAPSLTGGPPMTGLHTSTSADHSRPESGPDPDGLRLDRRAGPAGPARRGRRRRSGNVRGACPRRAGRRPISGARRLNIPGLPLDCRVLHLAIGLHTFTHILQVHHTRGTLGSGSLHGGTGTALRQTRDAATASLARDLQTLQLTRWRATTSSAAGRSASSASRV